MRSTYQDELLSKIKIKYGRKSCLLDIPDKPRRRQRLLFVYLPGMIALLPICIALAFLPKLPAPCVTKEMSLWTNTTCIPVDLSTEIRNHRGIGRREDFWGDNLRLSKEP
ncbi:hypothetical protein NPIL_631731 [Nephila pilipes]|uniref:Uncharacterized protein n=1 Tax=Nephila pilipes TaxID=299642 RepID=A0A8X6PAZ5_NEPPI|nr:hypothetical protein NPIL_631731 [Nephila pilipes]